ncbi:unnamed protein product [Parajaminaea phylloscopi]
MQPAFPRHLLSMSDLSPPQIQNVLDHAAKLKAAPLASLEQTLAGKTTALLFTKRSTRTRVATETSVAALGGHPMFLGPSDIQLGVNETLYDSAKIIGSMSHSIMARVGQHDEVETLAKESGVPVINALSALYHPTQILADLLTLLEIYAPKGSTDLSSLAGLKVAWVGDANNILYDMLMCFPRLGIELSIATPKGYEVTDAIWKTMKEGIAAQRSSGQFESTTLDGASVVTNDPLEAVRDADVIVTDTWISMGDEASKEQRLKDFAGYQITSEMAKKGGAKADWKFMHCLPRKPEEVSDEVFYSDRSVVFQEGENRKWTIMALADILWGRAPK